MGMWLNLASAGDSIEAQVIRVTVVVDIDDSCSVTLHQNVLIRPCIIVSEVWFLIQVASINFCCSNFGGNIVRTANGGSGNCRLSYLTPETVVIVISILFPIHNSIFYGLRITPAGYIGAIPGGHFIGQTDNVGVVEGPALEGVAGFGGGSYIGNGGAVAGVDGLHAVAAAQVEVHEVVVAVVVDLHNGGAVGGDGGLFIREDVEAFVGFRNLRNGGIGQALLGLPGCLGVVVIVQILPVVDDGIIYVGGLVGDGVNNVLLNICNIQINRILLHLIKIRQVALDGGEGDSCVEIGASGQSGDIGLANVNTVLKDVVDYYLVGCRGFADGKRGNCAVAGLERSSGDAGLRGGGVLRLGVGVGYGNGDRFAGGGLPGGGGGGADLDGIVRKQTGHHGIGQVQGAAVGTGNVHPKGLIGENLPLIPGRAALLADSSQLLLLTLGKGELRHGASAAVYGKGIPTLCPNR